MSKLATSLAVAAALMAVSAGCAEPETPATAAPQERVPAPTVFSTKNSDAPLPADQVFVPQAHTEDGALLFRIQMLPGYYLYKDKVRVLSRTDGISLDDHRFIDEWSDGKIVVDEWFGEQEVFFNEAHGAAKMRSQTPGIRSVDVELSYQGCKQDGICYVPQTKVLSVAIPAKLESAPDQTE